MSNPYDDSLNDDVLFPDDLVEYGGRSDRSLKVVDHVPIEADDVPHEIAQYGKWLEVTDGEREMYMSAPEMLRRFLRDAYAEHGENFWFHCYEAERGPEDHDPWQFSLKVVDEAGRPVGSD